MTVLDDSNHDVENKEDRAFTNLYVKCFPPNFNEQDLSELFGGFGPIQAVKVMTDARGRSSGFVNFEKPEDAKSCIDNMHRKDLRSRQEKKEAKRLEAEGKAPDVQYDADGHPVHLLYVGRAQTKEERAAMLEKQYGAKGAPKGKGETAKGKGKGGTVFFNGKGQDEGAAGGQVEASSQQATATPASNTIHTSTSAPEMSLPYSNGMASSGLSYLQQQHPQMYQPSYSNGNSYSEGDQWSHSGVAENGCNAWDTGAYTSGDGAAWESGYNSGWSGWGNGAYSGSYGYGAGETSYEGSYGNAMYQSQQPYHVHANRHMQHLPARGKGTYWQL